MHEVGTDALNARMAAVRSLEEIATSVITFAEIHAIFARRFRENIVGRVEFHRIRAIFESDWAGHLSKLEVSATVLGFIKGLVERSPLRGADAIHLASALSLTIRSGSSTRPGSGLVFATSDRQLKTAAATLGMEVFDPEEN
jgi:predicted nucleic acid-binding protein